MKFHGALRQRQVQRRQPRKAQPPDHPAQRRPLHQQGEQDKAGGKDADLALDARRLAQDVEAADALTAKWAEEGRYAK